MNTKAILDEMLDTLKAAPTLHLFDTKPELWSSLVSPLFDGLTYTFMSDYNSIKAREPRLLGLPNVHEFLVHAIAYGVVDRSDLCIERFQKWPFDPDMTMGRLVDIGPNDSLRVLDRNWDLIVNGEVFEDEAEMTPDFFKSIGLAPRGVLDYEEEEEEVPIDNKRTEEHEDREDAKKKAKVDIPKEVQEAIVDLPEDVHFVDISDDEEPFVPHDAGLVPKQIDKALKYFDLDIKIFNAEDVGVFIPPKAPTNVFFTMINGSLSDFMGNPRRCQLQIGRKRPEGLIWLECKTPEEALTAAVFLMVAQHDGDLRRTEGRLENANLVRRIIRWIETEYADPELVTMMMEKARTFKPKQNICSKFRKEYFPKWKKSN